MNVTYTNLNIYMLSYLMHPCLVFSLVRTRKWIENCTGRRRRRGRTIVRRKLYQVLISSSCLPFRGFLHGNLLEILSFPIHSSPETYEAFIPLRLHSLFFPTCSHFLVTSCDVFILCSVSPYSPGDIGSLYLFIINTTFQNTV